MSGNITTLGMNVKGMKESLIHGMYKTMVSSISRTLTGTGSTTKFPSDLSGERYVQIIVFDTSEGDPNAFLAQGAGKVIDSFGSSFSDLKSLTTLPGASGTPSTPAEDLSTPNTGTNKESKEKNFSEMYKGFTERASADWDTFISKWSKNGAGNPGIKKDKVKDNIFLALPNELSEELNHSYNNNEPSLFDTVKGMAIGANLFVNAGINTITGTSNIIAKASGRQALSYNKNLLAKFESSDFRSITLNWTLIANSQEEAINIQTIITKLKAYSSPQAVASKLLLRAPFYCELKFGNPILNKALKFEEVVITQISVNYSVSGYMETFHDDMPKTISLSITFQDREPKTMQAWGSSDELSKGYG